MTDRPHRDPLHSVTAWLCLLIPLVVGLGSDLAVKAWAYRVLVAGQYVGDDGRIQLIPSSPDEVEFLPGILHFRAHLNYGAVFGLGDGARVLFIIVSILALGLLGYLFLKSGRQRLYQVLLGMLFAGVMGNLYDRIVHGFVRDMIYAFPNSYWSDVWSRLPHAQLFPWIFNIADSLLCVGVAGMFCYTMLRRDDPMTAPPERARRGKPLDGRAEPAQEQ